VSSPSRPESSRFEPQLLLEQLNDRFPRPARYWVAFSGGLDSTVLLHVLASARGDLRAPLSAIHIDHALQAGSTDWVRHCREQCGQLDVPLHTMLVDAAAPPGESPEAAARNARYTAIAAALGPRAMLLTAHHLDDQAETLLLQLLRGAGVEGLAAMPSIRAWHGGWHARPLLAWRRDALHAWATAKQLGWIQDPSNAQTAAYRNYLRHQIVPLLRARWPASAAGPSGCAFG
jgi:tRNA(Ile)-lysidine synthase